MPVRFEPLRRCLYGCSRQLLSCLWLGVKSSTIRKKISLIGNGAVWGKRSFNMLKNSKPSLERLNLLGPLILLGALGISLLVVEGLAQLYYRGVIRKNFQQPGMYRYDPRKGWVLNDGVFRQKHYDFEALYTISDGRRRTVSSAGVEHETLNIYGDSFAFGIGVPDEETIASHLSQLGLSSVQNLGVSGYGPDQYFLAYQDAVSRQAAAWHLFLIYTGNDYKDLIAATDEGKQRYKPVLQPKGPGYVWLYPPGYEVHSSSRAFAFYSFQFLKYLAKSSALLIRLYNSLASPDRDLVNEALQRFDYLYSSLPRDKCFFAIVP